MKLQKDELAAVASHILEEIRKKNEPKLLKKEEKEIDDFLSEKASLEKQYKDISAKKEALRKKFEGKYGYNASYTTNKEAMLPYVKQYKQNKLPTLQIIKDQIIMKSLFSNETELKEFIKEIIAKY